MRPHKIVLSACTALALCLIPQPSSAKTTILHCREIDGVEKTSQLIIDLLAKNIRWIWHDMYRDYKITHAASTIILAQSKDFAFEYEISIDRESLIRTERRRALFVPGDDMKERNKTRCWLNGEEPRVKF